MTLLFTVLIVCGDTLTLDNGELFVGKVIAQNEERVWLALSKGGTLSFERNRIAHLELSRGKTRPKPEAPLAVEKPKDASNVATTPGATNASVTKATVTKPSATKDPAAAGAPPAVAPLAVVPTLETVARYGLKCPAGFERDSAAERPPLVCVLNEAQTGARIVFSAEPCHGGLEEAVEAERAEIGAALLAERPFRLRDAELDGRLLECDVASQTETRGELRVVFVCGNVKYKLSGSVRKEMLEQYRDLFKEVFVCFKLAARAPSDGPPQVQPRAVQPPQAQPPQAQPPAIQPSAAPAAQEHGAGTPIAPATTPPTGVPVVPE